MCLLHDHDMDGFVSTFGRKMIKTAQEVAGSTFCLFPLYTRLSRSTVLSLDELNSASTFPTEAIDSRIRVEWRVMNERRSRPLSLGLIPHHASQV